MEHTTAEAELIQILRQFMAKHGVGWDFILQVVQEMAANEPVEQAEKPADSQL